MHAVISAIKAYSCSIVQNRLQQLREVMGGHGFSRFNLMGNFRNMNDINNTWEGDNTVLNQQTAKFIIENFKQKMKGKVGKNGSITETFPTLKFLDTFDLLTDEKVEFTSSSDFDDLDKIKSVFMHRINLKLKMSIGKLSQRVEENKDQFLVAWNNSQVFYIQQLVRAYIENFIFDCFREKIDEIQKNLKNSTSSTKNVFVDMLKLFSLTIFENDLSTLRHDDFMSSDSCYMIKDEILNLCEKLKEDFITIIDVISAPDEILNAPMGRSDGRIWDSYISRVFGYNKAFEREDWWQSIHYN